LHVQPLEVDTSWRPPVEDEHDCITSYRLRRECRWSHNQIDALLGGLGKDINARL
jgi:hypothetical protein